MGLHLWKGKWIAFCELCYAGKRFDTKDEALEWWLRHRKHFHRIG
jgi:hypothetical protein